MPAEDYNVLSGDTRNNQDKATKSYNALLAPGAKMNKAAGTCGQSTNPNTRCK